MAQKNNIDGGWAWMVLLGSFFTFCISGGFSYTNGIFYVSMLRQFGHSHAYTSWMISLATSFFQMAGPLGCGLITRLGCRGTMVVGAVVMSIGFIIAAFASSFLTVLVSYGVIMAVGQCFTYCSTIVVLNEYFLRLHALATSVAMTGNGVGMFIMGHSLDYLTTTRGWRETFIACAAMSLQLCIVGFCFFPVRQKHSQKSTTVLGGEKKTGVLLNDVPAVQNKAVQSEEMIYEEHIESNNGYGKCVAQHRGNGATKHSAEEVIENIQTPRNNNGGLSRKEYGNSAEYEPFLRRELLESLIYTKGAEKTQVQINIDCEKAPEEASIENNLNKKKLEFGRQLKQIPGNTVARWDSRDFMARACLALTSAQRHPLRSPLLGNQHLMTENRHSFCSFNMLSESKLPPFGSPHGITNKHTYNHNNILFNQSPLTKSCKNLADICPTTESIEFDRQPITAHNMKACLKEDGYHTSSHSWKPSVSNDRDRQLLNSTQTHLEPANSDGCQAAQASKSIFEKRKLFPDGDEEVTEAEYEDWNNRLPKAEAEKTKPHDFFQKANQIFRLPRYHPHVWGLGISTMLVQMAAATHYGLSKGLLMSAGVGEAYPTMLSIMGTTDLLSRLVTGLLCTVQTLDVTVLYMTSMMGISMALLMYAVLLYQHTTTVGLFYFLSGAFAFCYASSNVLLAVVPARLFGREQLAQIFGVQLFWCGVGAFIGPIIGGFLVDTVDSYTVVQIFTSSCAAAGAACTLIVICTSAPATVTPKSQTPLAPKFYSSDVLAPSTRDPPAPSAHDPPAPSTRDPSAPSARDPPAPSPRDLPASSTHDPLLPSASDPPAPSTLDPPAPSTHDPLVPSARDSPVPPAHDPLISSA
ncbi:Major facilitator superfamily [Trinorchestia longiramus]|nr:Major facilitator superfamily [Trinorchestia longiramus]